MKTEYQKCMAGEPFDGTDAELAAMTLRTKRLLARFNATDYADTGEREAILRELFGSMGDSVHVDIDFHCEYGRNIFIGDRVIINMNCTFVDNNRIDIGNGVLIASNVQIYTATHPTKAVERMVNDWNGNLSIKLKNTTTERKNKKLNKSHIPKVLPGVTVGRNSVVGAGSVVTRSIPADCVAVGNPCRVLKHLTEE